EAEWEKAARGTNANIYPWGNTDPKDNLLNFNGNVGDTTEVGSYPEGASIYGALDMSGNVNEWVYDWYDSLFYQNSQLVNPQGPDEGKARGLRGGSWDGSSDEARSSTRFGISPSINLNLNLGFRCAMDAD
ncbi:MAG TPA: hypothetical protein DEP19_07335, partial [Anaerolineae bacterium]|nr:hypothetical protein [Anaerolineae bacterium]